MSKYNPLNLFKLEINPNRIFGLDVLRAFAIMVVVIGHGDHLIPKVYKPIYNYLIYDGVSIFFVLSGFLIGKILIKILESQPANFATLRHFWMRRWLRTLPNYFLVLITLMIIISQVNPNFSVWNNISFFWFGQNFASPHLPFFGEAWSLSIEEWFYLLVPIFIFLLISIGKIPPRYAVLIVAVFILLAVTNLRYIRYLTHPNVSHVEWDLIFRKQVITRLDSLMYGVIGAYLYTYKHALWIKYKVPLFIIGMLMVVGEKFGWKLLLHRTGINLYFCVFTFIVSSLGTLFMLPLLNSWKSTTSRWLKPVTYISLISYSMYLLNLNIMVLFVVPKMMKAYWPHLSGNQHAIVGSIWYWVLTVGCSILIYKYFELPFMKLRDRFEKPKAKSV